MKKVIPLPLIVALAVPAFSGCSQDSLTKVDRAKYGRVGFQESVKKPKKYEYRDGGMSATTVGTGIAFGLSGLLIATIVNSAREGKARKHSDKVVAARKLEPEKILLSDFRKQVEALGYFDTKSPNPNAHFRLEITEWGFMPAGKGRIAAKLGAIAQLVDAKGDVVWEREANERGVTAATIEQFEADPSLFQMSFEQASEEVARRLTIAD